MTPLSADQLLENGEAISVRDGHGKVIHFHHRPAGPDYFPKIIEEIHGRKLARASAQEMISIFSHAYAHPTARYSNLVLDSLRHEAQVYADTGILVVPRAGALIEDFPLIRDGKVIMEQGKLFERLENRDKRVRFVPEGYRVGNMEAEYIGIHPLVVGICGYDGAERIAKFAVDNGKRKVYVGSIPNSEDENGKNEKHTKHKKESNHARIAAFKATAKDTFWVFSEYPDAHENVFGFSYGILKREESAHH